MTRDDNVLLNDVYFNAYNINSPLTPLTPMSKLFAPFEGIGVHSGVPTRTTSTLTPTTLKNIEQSIMGMTNDNQMHLPYQAGFVPPPYPLEEHSQDREASQESCSSNSNTSWPVSGSHGYGADDLDSKSSASLEPPPLTSSSSSHGGGHHHGSSSFAAATGTGEAASSRTLKGGVAAAATTSGARGTSGRRNVGGRRPHKPSNLSPEEEEKRRIRRERNKQAAARCRRRREDHTNELVDETDQLEQRRQTLQKEIQDLQQEKDELEFLLETHREHCRLQGRRSPLDMKPMGLIEGSANAAALLLPTIKTEPEEELSQQPTPPQQQQKLEPNEAVNADTLFQGVPPMKTLRLTNTIADSLNTPPTVSLSLSRPGSLNVKPEEFQLGMASGGAPSNGLFNFESLMQGGTGLTPIAAPISFSANRNPLEQLITPTSTEPSKLFSL
ncbi:transcription factor kayak isoform X2 [Anopheles bellator]|uniref:transcription factor kayak isoform X2 n=1 Tax=Anopheles bellator TaxID=139047 RepID=UPI0026497137|nr:transcription factor kayak isoform X2 [Anopheles bellator]